MTNFNEKRVKFEQFLKDSGLNKLVRIHSSITKSNVPRLKFERIDRYYVNLLIMRDIKAMYDFCQLHGIDMYFGFDKLHIGFNSDFDQTQYFVDKHMQGVDYVL